MGRQSTIQGYNRKRPDLITQRSDLLLNFTASSLNLLLPSQKKQDVALALVLVYGHSSLDSSLDIVRFRLFAEIDVNRKHSARYV